MSDWVGLDSSLAGFDSAHAVDLHACVEELQEALQIPNPLFGEVHDRTDTDWNPHRSVHFGIGGFVRFDLEVAKRDPCSLGFLQLGKLVSRHLLFKFCPSRIEPFLPFLIGSRNGLAHAGGGAIPVHGGIHGDVDRVFDFAPLGSRYGEQNRGYKKEFLHGVGISFLSSQ